jgi:hypothetical protein
MENLNIDSQLQNTLSRFSLSLYQISYGAIVSKKIYNKMLLGELDRKILTGFKFYHLKSDFVFDVITEYAEMNLLPEIDEKMAPLIHTFNYPEISKPQQHLLALHKQFPKITKAFICFPDKQPRFERLITNDFGSKMFVSGAYIILDETDYYSIAN